MEILSDDLKNELKEKIKGVDVKTGDFQDNVKAIIDAAIESNKDKIREEVTGETVDEHLEKELSGFQELENLLNEGVLDDIDDEHLKGMLTEQSKGLVDVEEERKSIERAGFPAERLTAITKQDIINEILEQFESAIEIMKLDVEKKLAENQEMLKKVNERQKLRNSYDKLANLQSKTQEYKGQEGKKLNENLVSAVENLKNRIDSLAKETTVEGKELESDELNEKIEELNRQKDRLEKALKEIKETYQSKETGDDEKAEETEEAEREEKEEIKAEFTKKVAQSLENIPDNITPEELIKYGEEVAKISESYKKKNINSEECNEILKKIKFKESNYSASEIGNIGLMNNQRRNYIRYTHQLETENDMSSEDKKSLEQKKEHCRKSFEKSNEDVEKITGKKAMPIKTEGEYLEELEDVSNNLSKKSLMPAMFGKNQKKASEQMSSLRTVFTEIFDVAKNKGRDLIIAYNNIIDELQKNSKSKIRVPEKFEVPKQEKNVVEKVDTPIPEKNTEGEKAMKELKVKYFDEL